MAARDEAGNLLYRIAWFTDLTEQSRLEKQTREAERQFEDAFHRAADGMALVGLDGRWLRANPALCEILGYEEAELRELTFAEITHPDDLAANLEGDEMLLQGEAERLPAGEALHPQGRQAGLGRCSPSRWPATTTGAAATTSSTSTTSRCANGSRRTSRGRPPAPS